MANKKTLSGREKAWEDLLLDSELRCIVLTDDYTFSDSHVSLADITVDARIIHGTSLPLTDKDITDNVFVAADAVWDQLNVIVDIDSMYLYKVGTTEATSWLVAFWDVSDDLPLTTNGGGVVCEWADEGIFVV